MAWSLLFYGLLPLLAFAVAEALWGMRWAVWVAVGCAFVDVFLSYFYLHQIDPGSVVALFLICALGIVSLKAKNPLFLKLQPVAMALLFAAILSYFQFWGGGILKHYGPMLQAAMPESSVLPLDQPELAALLDRAISGLVLVFVVHGIWMAWAALRQKSWVWLLVRGVGFWAVLALYLMGFAAFTVLTAAR